MSYQGEGSIKSVEITICWRLEAFYWILDSFRQLPPDYGRIDIAGFNLHPWIAFVYTVRRLKKNGLSYRNANHSQLLLVLVSLHGIRPMVCTSFFSHIILLFENILYFLLFILKASRNETKTIQTRSKQITCTCTVFFFFFRKLKISHLKMLTVSEVPEIRGSCPSLMYVSLPLMMKTLIYTSQLFLHLEQKCIQLEIQFTFGNTNWCFHRKNISCSFVLFPSYVVNFL